MGPCKARHQALCPVIIEHLSYAIFFMKRTGFDSELFGFIITAHWKFLFFMC